MEAGIVDGSLAAQDLAERERVQANYEGARTLVFRHERSSLRPSAWTPALSSAPLDFPVAQSSGEAVQPGTARELDRSEQVEQMRRTLAVRLAQQQEIQEDINRLRSDIAAAAPQTNGTSTAAGAASEEPSVERVHPGP